MSLRRSAGAFGLYLAVSLVYFGARVLAHPTGWFIGWGTDPSTHMWFLAWWPHAIRHGLNPFVTHLLWAPSGYNLANATAIPGPSLLMAPFTETLGPVVSYNILVLLAPAVSAWTAYLLCRHVSGAHWPSVVGGYLYGFSTYELGQLMGHPNLSLVFLVPVCVLLVLRRVDGSLTRRAFMGWLALALFLQFLTSAEVSLTLAFFGLMALVAALLIFPGPTRARLLRTGLEAAGAYALAAIPLVPYLYYIFRSLAEPPVYSFYPWTYSTDLANFVTPTPLVALGGRAFARVASNFSGNVSEQVAYLGLPLLLAVGLYSASAWRRRTGRFLLVMFLLLVVATLGPALHVMGSLKTSRMPWRALVGLPFFRFALPARFMLYAFLVLGVMMAEWLPAGRLAGWGSIGKWALVALGIVFLVPNVGSGYWKTQVDTPVFFSSGMYRSYLAPGENTVILPFGRIGNSMLWQAETGFFFSMAEGYVAVIPPKPFSDEAIVEVLEGGQVPPTAPADLRRFLAENRVRTIIAGPGTRPGLDGLLLSIDPAPVSVGGVRLYRVPP